MKNPPHQRHKEIEPIYNRRPKLKGERTPIDLDRLSELWFSVPVMRPDVDQLDSSECPPERPFGETPKAPGQIRGQARSQAKGGAN